MYLQTKRSLKRTHAEFVCHSRDVMHETVSLGGIFTKKNFNTWASFFSRNFTRSVAAETSPCMLRGTTWDFRVHDLCSCKNVSNVVEEISFGDSVMPFHQNELFFPNTMQKAANILTEIYLHILLDGMFSYFIFNLQRKEYWRAKRVLSPVFLVDENRRIWLCEWSLM